MTEITQQRYTQISPEKRTNQLTAGLNQLTVNPVPFGHKKTPVSYDPGVLVILK
jgi:hypothetical protein